MESTWETIKIIIYNTSSWISIIWGYKCQNLTKKRDLWNKTLWRENRTLFLNNLSYALLKTLQGVVNNLNNGRIVYKTQMQIH